MKVNVKGLNGLTDLQDDGNYLHQILILSIVEGIIENEG